MTIHSLWNDARTRHAALPAVSWVGETPWTYAELDSRVTNLIARWNAQGVSKGDRIALWASNAPGWGVVYLATTTWARVIVPILPDFSLADVVNVVAHSGATVLVLGASQADSWAAAQATLTDDQKAARVNLRVEALDDLLELPSADASLDAVPASDDLAALIYTSGTTGASKGVMLTKGGL